MESTELGLSFEVKLGKPAHFEMAVSPDIATHFRRIRSNVNFASIFFIEGIWFGNIYLTQGHSIDAMHFYEDPETKERGRGKGIDPPIIDPANRLRMRITYTGEVPPGHKDGEFFNINFLFTGVMVEPILQEANLIAAHEKQVWEFDRIMMAAAEVARKEDKSLFDVLASRYEKEGTIGIVDFPTLFKMRQVRKLRTFAD